MKIYFFWNLFAVLCFSALTQYCPENCFCSRNQRDALTTRCLLDTDRDYSALTGLPSSVTELECQVKEPFREIQFNINNLPGVQRLVIRPEKVRRAGLVSSKTATLGYQNPNIFHHLNKLKHLAIHLSLFALNPNILRSLEHLQVLDLAYTEYFSVGKLGILLQGISVARLPLVTLNLTRVHVGWILTGSEYEPLNVRTNVYRHLTSIHTLRTLDIRDNGVVQLHAGLSEFLPNITELYIGENVFNYFQGGHISSLCSVIDAVVHPALRKIYYSFVPGSKSRIHKRAFQENEVLINAFMNGLKKCSVFPFDFCEVLNCICLNETRIPCSFVDDQRFAGVILPSSEANCVGGIQIPLPVNLEELIIRGAPAAVQGTEMNIGQNESYCFLPDNRLSLLDMASSNLDYTLLDMDFSIAGLSHLTTVNLEFNYLDLVKISTWFKRNDIKTLLLSGNALTGNGSFLDSLFVNFPDVEVLSLSECQMTDTPSFGYLTELEKLDLSRNDLTAFSANIGSLSNLRILNLRDNKISSLPSHVTNALNKIPEHGTIQVDLSGNPLLCQCHTLGFVSWMQSKLVTFSNNNSLLCRSRTGALISPWDIDLDEERKICNNFYSLLYGIVACVLVIALAAIGAVSYRKRWTVRYWIHAAREGWRRRRDQRATREMRRYKYDAFVAYCSRDTVERQWVHLLMVPKLEGDHGLKMCIHHRDFLPGIDIQDNIVDAINNSRKTVLVLSPSFLESDWCNFEVRMARVKLVEERRDNIVLVLYKSLDIPGTRVPRKLMNLLDKQTYVAWTTEARGQELFWKKLVSALRRDAPQAEPYGGLNVAVA